jgi:hypothetical protein
MQRLRETLVRWMGGRTRRSEPPLKRPTKSRGLYGAPALPGDGVLEVETDSLVNDERARAVLQEVALGLLDEDVRGFVLVSLTGEHQTEDGTVVRHLEVSSLVSGEHTQNFAGALTQVAHELRTTGPQMPNIGRG